MKIQVEVDIFDDPEYCENDTHSCPQMTNYYKNQKYCRQFDLMRLTSDRLTKCPQCKAALKRAKDTKRGITERQYQVQYILSAMSPQSALLSGYITQEEYSGLGQVYLNKLSNGFVEVSEED